MVNSSPEPQDSGTVYIPNNAQMTHEQLAELRKKLRQRYQHLFRQEEGEEEE